MALFYEKDVPLELAHTFYNACNGRHSRFVVEQSSELYREWRGSKYKRHIEEYYSIFSRNVYTSTDRCGINMSLFCPK